MNRSYLCFILLTKDSLFSLGSSRRKIIQTLDRPNNAEISVSLIVENYAGLNQHVHLKPDNHPLATVHNNHANQLTEDIFDCNEIELEINKTKPVTPSQNLPISIENQKENVNFPEKRMVAEMITPKSLRTERVKRIKMDLVNVVPEEAEELKSQVCSSRPVLMQCGHQCKDKQRYK